MKYFSIPIIFLVFILSCTDTSNQGANIATDATEICPLLIGSQIPDITLPDPNGDNLNLNEISKPKALFVFYRGGWCPFCSAELAEIAKIEDDLHSDYLTAGTR